MQQRTVDPDTGEVQVRPFADWLRDQSRGASHDELSDALNQLVATCIETGKPGTLQYTVKVDPKAAAPALVVTDAIKLRLPEYDRDGSIFWADKHGNLRRENPAQMSFDSLREVAPVEVKDEKPQAKKGSTA